MQFRSNLQVLLFVVLGYVTVAVSIPIFSGNAGKDFANFTGPDAARYFNFHDDDFKVEVTPYMAARNRKYGLDVIGVHTYYDERTDILYQGVECDGICGDSDGDGDPDNSEAVDNPDDLIPDARSMCEYEAIVLNLWADVGEDYEIGEFYTYFFPTFTIGKPFTGCYQYDGVNNWLAYEYPNTDTCNWDYYKVDPSDSCFARMRNVLRTPADRDEIFAPELALANIEKYANEGVKSPDMFSLVLNSTQPSIEYQLGNYSKYPGFRPTYQRGSDTFRMSLVTYSANSIDLVGEDRTPPKMMIIQYDCFGVPAGPARYDECGVCNGNNQTCWDCAHIPNGPHLYDFCGVCDGNNQTCWDCEGTPNGPKRYDYCGVCDGNNQTCWDCAHIPNGNAQYDYCGVCDGNNSTCWDCAHTPNGPMKYDFCGVCDGDNTTCWDCLNIPNGPNRYDYCGVCNGDNTTCWDCLNIPNGGHTYDQCGICDGDGTTCLDCFAVPFGTADYDGCGVCGGMNETCTCYGYLGYKEPYLCYALTRWTIAAARVKITDTLDVLYAIKNELPYYDYKSGELALDEYVDKIHNFCDGCLDQFDFASVWFADRLAGNCVGAKCKNIVREDFSFSL